MERGGGKHLETMGLHKDLNRESFESLIQSLQTSTLLVKSELTEHRKEKNRTHTKSLLKKLLHK